MKALIFNKINQRSTWVAFGTAGALLVARFVPDYLDLYLGILTAFGLAINDRKGV